MVRGDGAVGSRGGGIKTFLGDLDAGELGERLRRLGEKTYRARQILDAYFSGADSIEDITVLPVALRGALARELAVCSLKPVRTVGSMRDAKKILFRLHDEHCVESVLLFESDRVTACLSTQVGCPVGCVFCASGLGGFVRNLSCAEIIDQFLRMRSTLPRGKGITNIVVMGMGEPFLNYYATVRAVRRLNAPDGAAFGARRITVSTIGIPRRMIEFAREEIQVNLAVSLHAADDEKRSRIVPSNLRYPVEEIINAARTYFEMTGREVTFEYVLLAGLNDSREDAVALARRVHELPCSVNLIPVNEVAGLTFKAPSSVVCRAFAQTLIANGVTATIRKSKGNRSAAACGQLRLVSERVNGDRGF